MIVRAYGLTLELPDGTPGAWAGSTRAGLVDLEVRLEPGVPRPVGTTACPPTGWEATIDGDRFLCVPAPDGGLVMRHGTHAEHLLDADGRVLTSRGRPDARFWRVLLDAVLSTVALRHGRQALHAAAVATPAGAVAVSAPPGTGKTTLGAALLRAGATLLADDIVVLAREDGGVVAHPAPPVMSLPEDAAAVPGEAVVPLGTADGERWAAVPVHAGPVALRAIVLLSRSTANPGVELVDVPRTAGAVLGSLLRFPRGPDADVARFHLAADLTGSVAVRHLAASPDVAPGTLAQAVLDALVST